MAQINRCRDGAAIAPEMGDLHHGRESFCRANKTQVSRDRTEITKDLVFDLRKDVENIKSSELDHRPKATQKRKTNQPQH